jgi:hypothetical protein
MKAWHHIDGNVYNNHPDNWKLIDIKEKGKTMKTKKYTHAEFIKMIAINKAGIDVDKITRNYVYVKDSKEDYGYWWPRGVTPVKINLMAEVSIPYITEYGGEVYTTTTIIGAIEKDFSRIPIIKEIRHQTGMMLKDAKNFVEVNFFNYPMPKED